MNKNDYTVLLTLKDRFAFTKRWLKYMSESEFPYKILIADGSIDDSVKMHLDGNKDKFKCLDIEYVRYPYDADYSMYYRKVAEALKKVKTRYVSFADNDDFLMAEGVQKSVEFLDAHPDYVACRGLISSIAVFGRKKDGDALNVFGKIGGICYRYYYSETIDSKSATDRVMSHSKRYDPTFYDVQLTEQLRARFEMLRDLDIENIYLAEYLTSYMTVAEGKVKRFSIPYYFRQTNTSSSCNSSESARYDFFERMLLPSWSHDYCNSAEAVAKIMSEKDGISHDEAIKVFMKAYKIHSGPNVIWSVKRENEKPLTVLNKVFRKISHYRTKLAQSFIWRRSVDVFGIRREYFKALQSIADFLREKDE